MLQEVTSHVRDINRITEGLRQLIGEQRFDLWFGDVDRLRLNSGILTVAAADSFTLARIRAQFARDFDQLTNQFPELIHSVTFELDATSATPSPPRPLRIASPQRRQPKPAPAMREQKRPVDVGTFEFGSLNNIAKTATEQVLGQPGEISPLFFNGAVGSGKTHLLLEMCQSYKRRFPQKRSVYVSAEQFTTEFVEALKGKGLPLFRMKYREIDLLAIDDVQFFSNKLATLVELQHTIDSLVRQRRQIILAADRPPIELTFMEPELINRCSSGLVCRLEYPCSEARMAILKRLSDSRSLPLSETVAEFIAETLDSDVRQVQGAVNRLHAAHLSGLAIDTLEAAEHFLADLLCSGSRAISIEAIEEVVCEVCGVDGRELKSPKRSQHINAARNLAMWLARKHTGQAFSDIGSHFGGRSHSTVISAHKKVTSWLACGARIRVASGSMCQARQAVERIEHRLRCG